MAMEENFETVIIKVEPQDDDYEGAEYSTRKDAERLVESLQTVQTECEETDLNDASLRDIMAGIDGVSDLDVSEMEVVDLKMEIQDDIDMIEKDEFGKSIINENDYQLKKEIQEDIEMIERNENQNGMEGENDDDLSAELANLDESGIVELVERDVLDLVRKHDSKDIYEEGSFHEIEENKAYPEDATYSCVLCGQSVQGGTAAKSHLLDHIEKENYNCMDCDGAYTSNCFKVKHCLVCYQVVGETSLGKLYKYYSAPQLLRNENLNSIENTNNNIKVIRNGEVTEIEEKLSIPNDRCDKPIESKLSEDQKDSVSSLSNQSGVKTDARKGQIMCLECCQTFTSIENLRSHNVKEHVDKNSHICRNCNMTFPDEKKLKSHLRSFEEKGCQIHLCTFCNKMYRKADPMKSHMFIHTGRGSFECEQCGKTWKTRSILMRHMESHWTEKKHLCSVCNKYFATANSLKMHMYIHTGERSFPCTECSKVYTEKRFLRVHMCKHTGQGKHICKICSKRYYSSSQLKLHMCKHTGERPHVCKICNEAFLVRNSLMRHMYRHTGEKPFACMTCQKRFILKQDLQEHIKTHSVRSYTCSLCNRAFTTGAYLNRHMKQHNDVGKCKCNFCGLNFATKMALKRHEISHQQLELAVRTFT